MCENRYQRLKVLSTPKWHSQPSITLIHSSDNFHSRRGTAVKNPQVTKNLYESEEKSRQRAQIIRAIIYENFQADQKSIIKMNFSCKTEEDSNFMFYWRGPHKADPKKMEETTTQGSYLLVDSSLTCKNNTHLYKKHTTSQYNCLYKKIVIQGKGGVIKIKYKTRIKLPRNMIGCLNGHTKSWNMSTRSRSPTAVTTFIITRTGLVRPNQLVRGARVIKAVTILSSISKASSIAPRKAFYLCNFQTKFSRSKRVSKRVRQNTQSLLMQSDGISAE